MAKGTAMLGRFIRRIFHRDSVVLDIPLFQSLVQYLEVSRPGVVIVMGPWHPYLRHLDEDSM